ncbi:protein NDR1-like [Tasmannia lanceolata]|uniref:protein NDR1-like n=1 Tax=Tasmannia lanceolata TaxID=3420 RepID=UPI0040649C5B
MRTQTEIPIQYHPQERLTKRQRTRYYAHQVTESLRSRVFKLICTIFLSLLFFVGVILFVLWLSLRPHRPRFYVREFSIPGLNQDNGFQTSDMYFNVTIRNPNQNVGIYFDTMEGSVYYSDQRIGVTPLPFPFYQPPKNTVSVDGVLGGASLTVSDENLRLIMADRAMGVVVFRLDLTSKIRFKVATWQGRHHKMHTSCNVEVGPDGQILPTSKNKRCSIYFY